MAGLAGKPQRRNLKDVMFWTASEGDFGGRLFLLTIRPGCVGSNSFAPKRRIKAAGRRAIDGPPHGTATGLMLRTTPA